MGLRVTFVLVEFMAKYAYTQTGNPESAPAIVPQNHGVLTTHAHNAMSTLVKNTIGHSVLLVSAFFAFLLVTVTARATQETPFLGG